MTLTSKRVRMLSFGSRSSKKRKAASIKRAASAPLHSRSKSLRESVTRCFVSLFSSRRITSKAERIAVVDFAHFDRVHSSASTSFSICCGVSVGA